MFRECEETRAQIEMEREKERKARRVRMRRVKSMVDVDYNPRKEIFRFTYIIISPERI